MTIFWQQSGKNRVKELSTYETVQYFHCPSPKQQRCPVNEEARLKSPSYKKHGIRIACLILHSQDNPLNSKLYLVKAAYKTEA